MRVQAAARAVAFADRWLGGFQPQLLLALSRLALWHLVLSHPRAELEAVLLELMPELATMRQQMPRLRMKQ